MLQRFFIVLLLLFCGAALAARAQQKEDSTRPVSILESTAVIARDSSLRIAVRNIDITRFPNVGIIFDIFDKEHNFVDDLTIEDIEVTENGAPQEVLSLSLVTNANRIPIDFVFVIDQTGSMQDKIDAVKQHIDEFTTRLVAKGIDYRLGLIVFDDNVASRYWLTDDRNEFRRWIESIEAHGGGDEKENALEGLRAATGMNFRSSANRCVVLVTDAPYHQYGDKGSGRTMYTSWTMSTILKRYDIRTFAIVSPSIEGYDRITESTGGQLFDISRPFTEILNKFLATMTSLYTATYRSNADIIPDSVNVEIRLKGGRTAKKSFAVLEVGRKLVLNNIRFATNQYTIEPVSMPELDYLVRLMKARPTLKLEIEGHTDDVGDHYYNVRLSNLRANAVKEYMVKNGIAPNRLFTIGYGETRPVASNDTEEGRSLNRRTEFIIMQK